MSRRPPSHKSPNLRTHSSKSSGGSPLEMAHPNFARLEKLRSRKDPARDVDQFEAGSPDSSAPRVRALISEKALRQNFAVLADQVSDCFLLPMIKADAYGHGAAWAARTLECPDFREKLYGFGVATLDEGREIRQALGARARKRAVFIFSGAAGWNDEIGQRCELDHLTPVISSEEDWVRFLRGKWNERIPYELKFNTGMNRLGIGLNQLEAMAGQLRGFAPEHLPSGFCSHLAEAENPSSDLSRKQLQGFRDLRQVLKNVAPSAFFHLGNSAAIWNFDAFDLAKLTDVVRPGLSLYGVSPWAGAPSKGLVPVMQLEARVGQVRRLKPGDRIGYGGKFRVGGGGGSDARSPGRDGPPPVGFAATLLAGYADGIHRRWSERGHVWIAGKRERILGNVSMDLTSVSAPGSVKAGDWAQFLGPEIDPWAQAKEADTIPYELLTSVSPRVKRCYGS